ncbi:MFS general substrate transporter, partial [Tuber magnatum]
VDIFLVTWDGPDDPANPQNWATGKKFLVMIILCVNTFCVTIGSADVSPAINRVKLQYGISTEVATLMLTFYVFGWATGPLIFSPASEIFGRNSVYRPTWALFVLFNLGCGLSSNITSLLICRLFAGVFSSTATAVGFGSAYDMFHRTPPPPFVS